MAPHQDRDPAGTHAGGKLLPSTTHLNDVNRRRVHPDDLIAHQGYSVLVTDIKGWIGKGLEGLYPHQTRFLSRFRLRVEETRCSPGVPVPIALLPEAARAIGHVGVACNNT